MRVHGPEGTERTVAPNVEDLDGDMQMLVYERLGFSSGFAPLAFRVTCRKYITGSLEQDGQGFRSF